MKIAYLFTACMLTTENSYDEMYVVINKVFLYTGTYTQYFFVWFTMLRVKAYQMVMYHRTEGVVYNLVVVAQVVQ